MQHFDLLGVKVSAVNLDTACHFLQGMVAQRQLGYVCVAPVATIMDARRDPAYLNIINAAALVTPDGMPVVWLGQRRAGAQVKRTYGPDVMIKLCDEGREFGLRHFFYGGTADVCDKLKLHLSQRFPGISIVGAIAPPFCERAGVMSQQEADIINMSGADIVWVGLGSPKQDFWMALNRSLLQPAVLIGIGAAFDFIAGVKPQAPRWLQRSGLEWLFRLCCEPRRLWRRYLIGNTQFVLALLQEFFQQSK